MLKNQLLLASQDKLVIARLQNLFTNLRSDDYSIFGNKKGK
jgi:hypothetical protein